MIIVIDTTETYKSLALDGPDWLLLGQYLRQESDRGFLPSVVVSETVNHFRENVTAAAEKVQQGIQQLNHVTRYLNNPVSMPALPKNELLNRFSGYLDKRMAELHLATLNCGQIRVDSLIARSLSRRKPFDTNGHKGFRDAVVWESILNILHTNPEENIAFVTANSKDFGTDQQLHDDLKADLHNASFAEDSIRIYPNLAAFCEQHVKPTLEKLDAIRLEIAESGRYHRFSTDELWSDIYADAFADCQIAVQWEDFASLGYPSRFFGEPHLVSLDDHPKEYGVSDVYRISANQLTFTVFYKVAGTIRCDRKCYDDKEHPYTQEFIGDATIVVTADVAIRLDSGEYVEPPVMTGTRMSLGPKWPAEDHS